MESRTRLAIGGMATVAASVTVICIVALTNSVALSESAGSSVGAAPIVVPASDATSGETPTPTPRVTPSPEAEPVEPVAEDPAESAPVAEVVPAPDAQVVTPVHPSPAAESPRPSAPATVEEAIAQAEASGSWDPVRAWAERQGWSTGRVDALIRKLERAMADYRMELDSGQTSGGSDPGRVQAPASDSGRVQSPGQDDDDRGARVGSSQGHRAKADEKAERRTEKSGAGPQKDRGDSSHQRDR